MPAQFCALDAYDADDVHSLSLAQLAVSSSITFAERPRAGFQSNGSTDQVMAKSTTHMAALSMLMRTKRSVRQKGIKTRRPSRSIMWPLWSRSCFVIARRDTTSLDVPTTS
eukprot:scaffold487074_cov45-Prasinocladus_malaysianus.AAC.1